MDLKIALKMLEGSSDFRRWQKKNRHNFFSYAFNIPQEMNNQWQLGYYDKKKDKITTFVVDKDSISIRPDDEVFKKEEAKIGRIDLGNVRLTFDSALEKADEFQARNFPGNNSIKTIAILQNMPEFGNIWNITYITGSFNTLNMKIDASTGRILEHNFASILSFRK